MSDELDLINGIAWALEQASVGTYVREGQNAPANSVPIVHAWLPDKPDTAISITIHGYPSDPNPNLPKRAWRVQIRMRNATGPSGLAELADDVRDALTGHRQEWGNLRVARCYRYSAIPMGRDASGRWDRSDNYHIITNPPL